MPKSRRGNARDVTLAGGLLELIKKLIDELVKGNMDAKEHGAMQLRSLTEQPKGLGGDKHEVENAVLIAQEGAIKPLVSLVVTGSAQAQAHACAALAHIGHHGETYQQAIVDHGGVQAIASALRLGDSALQEQAAAVLASTSQLSISREPFIKAGAIAPLINLLKVASADTHVHTCQALGNLAQGSMEGQNMIARGGALQLLIELLGSGKAQEAAAYAIAKLAQDNHAIQNEISELGGIPKLISLLSVLSIDAQAQAAAALAAVAGGDSSIKNVIAKAGGIRPLLVLVESKYPSAQRNAAHAIAMLALNHRGNQDSIAGMGGIAPLVSLTHHGQGHSPDVQAYAVLALTEIARHNKENQTAVADNGAIWSLVSLLKKSNSPIVEAEVAGAMWALSEDHNQNKVSIAGAGAIPALMTQLSSTVERAHVNAANALSSLGKGHSDNQAEIATLLVGLLEEASGDAQDRAAHSLWRIVEENPGNEIMIAKSGGPEPLVRLLNTSQPAAQAYALWSLSLSIDGENQKIVADNGGIEPLVQLLKTKNNVTHCEQAACALQRLATNKCARPLRSPERTCTSNLPWHGMLGPYIALRLRAWTSFQPFQASMLPS